MTKSDLKFHALTFGVSPWATEGKRQVDKFEIEQMRGSHPDKESLHGYQRAL